MATGTPPTLYPNPLLQGGPRLSLVDGWLVVTTPNGRTGRFATGRGTGAAGELAVGTLAHHTTRLRPPSGAGVRPRAVRRSSWRLLDTDGKPLVWLANSDQVLYEPAQAREFAAAAGIEFRDFGVVGFDELLADRPAGRLNGPGTGRLSSVVAPGRQWGMAAALLGGIAPIAPIAAASWSDGQIRGFGAVIVLVAFLTMAVVAPAAASHLAAGLGALRWRVHWRGREGNRRLLLTARRAPGFAVSAGSDRIELRDLRRTVAVPHDDELALQPYAITPDGTRPGDGLLIRGTGGVLAHIPRRFDPDEVHAFAGELGARSLPLLTHADQVPKPRPRRGPRSSGTERLESFVIGGPSLYVWGAIGWALTLASAPLVGLATAGLAGWIELPWPYAVTALAPGFLTLGAWTLYATQLPIWLRCPDRLEAGARMAATSADDGRSHGRSVSPPPSGNGNRIGR